jgi:hypothetical protein
MFQTLIDPAFLAFENGGTPVLDLNFAATKALDSRITFTRASVGTFVDSTGTLQTASSGEARFTHDPVTLRSLGLMIEGSRTNLLLNSATLSTQNVATTAAAHTLHFTGTGTITLTGTSTAGPLVGTGTGEGNRVSLTFTPTAGTLTLTVSGTVTNAQLEVGGFATSYIPTTGATVQRAADVAVMTGTNFSAWYNQTEGTIAANVVAANAATATILTIDDNSLNNRIYLQRESSSSNARGVVVTSGSTVATLGVSGVGTSLVAALSYKLNQFHFSAAGAAPVTDTAGAIPTVDRMRIGNVSVANFEINGTIARIRYFNRALANAVQPLTA